MEQSERRALFEQAREWSQEHATWPEASTAWGQVIKAYEAAIHESNTPDRDDQRQLARALWRQSMLLASMGQASAGLRPGQRAVALFGTLNQAASERDPDVTSPQRDEALAELITAMVDLGEVSYAAGDAGRRIALVDEALGIGLRTVRPPDAGGHTRAAMATGYHNYATAMLHRFLEHGGEPREAALAATSPRRSRMSPSW